MLAIPLLGFLGFYAAFYYGLDQLKGGNDSFLSILVPGRYKPVARDGQTTTPSSSTGTPSRTKGKGSSTNPAPHPGR